VICGEKCSDAATLVTLLSGCDLAASMALAAKNINPAIRVIEGAGAAVIVTLLDREQPRPDSPVALVVTGDNIDRTEFLRVPIGEWRANRRSTVTPAFPRRSLVVVGRAVADDDQSA